VAATVTNAAGCSSTLAAGYYGSTSGTVRCGSATATVCCASATAGRGSVASAALCEPPLAAVAVLTAARAALDERRLVGTTASVLSTLAGAIGGMVGATLRARRQET
jgi:hypothetical protein